MKSWLITMKDAVFEKAYTIKNELLFFILAKTCKYNILSREDTAEQIAAGKSVCRFGDGELGMLFGDPVCFQHDDARLKMRLKDILQSVETCNDNILLCLPGAMNHVNDMLNAPRKHWVNWNATHLKRLSPFLSKTYVYGDTNVSRLWLAWKDKSRELQIVKAIQRTLKNKNVVVVEGQGVRFGDGNDMLDGCRSIRRIICPATNAFDKYDEILSCCKKLGGVETFVIALGPTATVLAYDLAGCGYQALDLGHMDLQYEYLLRSANDRMDVGKENNELNNCTGQMQYAQRGTNKYEESICFVIE